MTSDAALRLARALLCCSVLVLGPLPASAAATVTVRTTAELLAALAHAESPTVVRLEPGDYPLQEPLQVPDRVVIRGAGRMQLDSNGLPAGFAPGTETTLRATAGFEGDLVTLGHGAQLRDLRVVDAADDPAPDTARAGNVIMVGSRARSDRIVATIRDCEIVNPNRFGVLRDGPAGHAIAVLTRNPARDLDPPPHDSSRLTLRLERSIVRATGGGGALFITNFAASSQIRVTLVQNRIEGLLSATAGVSRPDAVRESTVDIESRANLYSRPPGGFDRFGWQLNGGSSAHLPRLDARGASSNALSVTSRGDRIEGFRMGIQAAAARRYLGASGPLEANRVFLDLTSLDVMVSTENPAGPALSFQAALAERDPEQGQEFLVGDGNVLQAALRGVNVSGRAPNFFAVIAGPRRVENHGSGNRIVFAGGAGRFARDNPTVLPVPPAAFFGGAPVR